MIFLICMFLPKHLIFRNRESIYYKGKSISNGDTTLESLEKMFFDFLIIIFFSAKKRNINQSRTVTCCGDPQIMQRLTKKKSLFRNFNN